MAKRINWERTYKNLEHFWGRCSGTLEKMAQGCLAIGILMSLAALLTSFSESMTNVCELIATICFGLLVMLVGLYGIVLIVTCIIKFVFAVIVGIPIVCNWTRESSFGGK